MKQVRKYALLLGAGSFGALQAMKFELFTFPDGLKAYMGFFFSFVAILGIFLSGGITLLETFKNTRVVIDKIQDAEKKIEEGEEDENKKEGI